MNEELAKKIRMLLPESVDLFYEWKYYENIPGRYCERIPGYTSMGRDVPIIVPDMRTVICDASSFNLSLFRMFK